LRKTKFSIFFLCLFLDHFLHVGVFFPWFSRPHQLDIFSTLTDRTSSWRFILNVNLELKSNGVRELSILPGADDVFVINVSWVVNVDIDGVHSKLVPSSIIY